MELTKNLNDFIKCNIMSSNIVEYDLESAGATTLYFIKGKEVYDMLLSMPKYERNVKIGNMIRNDHTLYRKMQDMILSWFNMFIKANNIRESNLLATTPDSLLIYDKIATTLEFENGIVKFRNKERVTYTSVFKIQNKIILFDRLSKRVRIKGLGIEEETNEYDFIKCSLKNLCCILNDSVSLGRFKTLNNLKIYRGNYINSKNIDVYRSIDHKNKFRYIIDGEEFLSDTYLEEKPDCILLKSDNYENYILPLIQSFI